MEKKEEYEEELDLEQQKMEHMNCIQEELTKLNTSLNACISIASSSISADGLRKKYERMREENNSSYNAAKKTIENALEDSKSRINQILEEEKEEEKENDS